MGNFSGSRYEQRSKLVVVLSDEDVSLDDDLGFLIFEFFFGLLRSERYMRRLLFFGNFELVEVQYFFFFNLENG